MELLKLAIFVFVAFYQQCSCYTRKKIGLYWGGNKAMNLGQEDSLKTFCERDVYDIIIITSMNGYIPTPNAENLPSMDFKNHCGDNTLRSFEGIHTYPVCPEMERHINYCQNKGIKVLLDIRMTKGFPTKEMAEEFAEQVWGLFLGGSYQTKWRSFGDVVLDGINLTPATVTYAVETRHMVDFIRHLRKTMNKAAGRGYYLTFAPNCDEKEHDLNKAFQRLYSAFDSMYVDFSREKCLLENPEKFMPILNEWMFYANKSNGPNLYVSLTTNKKSPYIASRLMTKNLIENTFEQYTHNIGGIILNDASWNEHNIDDDNVRYSQFVKKTVYDMVPKPKAFVPRTQINLGGHFGAASSFVSSFIVVASTLVAALFMVF